MPTVEYTPKSLEDLKHIRKYISDNWGENVSRRILKKITADVKRLEQYPASGVELGKMVHVPTDYRYLFSERNYVFYRLEPDKVRIVRVLTEQQDYMEQLFGADAESQ